MENERREEKFLQSTIHTTYGAFFVSTIYRYSSAAANPDGRFYETFAWKLDAQGNRENSIIADNSGAIFPRGAINDHNEVLLQLSEKGFFENFTED